MFNKSGCPISHCQYLGRNFFLVELDDTTHRDDALDFPPWFYGQTFMYTFSWVPNFDVTTGNYNFLPLSVDFSYRLVFLESACFKLSHSLGEFLLFIRGNEHSIFPNDNACVLWDLTEPIPRSIKVRLSKSISIWQPAIFLNVPFSCYHCNELGHFARAYPRNFSAEDVDATDQNHNPTQDPPFPACRECQQDPHIART